MKTYYLKSTLFFWLIIFLFSCNTGSIKKVNNNEDNLPASKSMTTNKSAIKDTFDLFEFGPVYPSVIQYKRYEGYPTIEVYKQVYTGKLISGIERFGPYRIFNHMEYQSDSSYSGMPMIEIINSENQVSKIIYPHKEATILHFSAMIESYSGEGANAFHVKLNNIAKFIDPELKNKLPAEYLDSVEIFDGLFQTSFDIENKYILTEFRYKIFLPGQQIATGYEIIAYDSLGNIIANHSGYGLLDRTDITLNGKFLYVTTGGYLNEDLYYLNTLSIIETPTSNLIAFRKSKQKSECIHGFVIPNTNLGVYVIDGNCEATFQMKEAYVIDHNRNIFYLIHQHPKCNPPNFILFYSDYCKCIDKANNTTQLTYDNFKIEKLDKL